MPAHPEVTVLVSAGRHPVSGRPRRHPGDARALELALRLTDRPRALHAGDPGEPSLRVYLGMGLEAITVLECPPETNPIPCLAAELAERPPSLLLTGMQTEHGPATGYLPYALAEALGAPLAPAILGIEPAGDGFRLVQARPGGRRRALRTTAPAVVLVDKAAPAPRMPAFAAARRGMVHTQPPAVALPEEPEPEVHPARKRPKRLRVAGGSAAERQAAVRGATGGGAQVLDGVPPEEAARAILGQLVAAGLIAGAEDPGGETVQEDSVSG